MQRIDGQPKPLPDTLAGADKHPSTSPKRVHVDEDKERQGLYLSAPQVRRRYGNVSDMSLWRWERDPKLGFPQPLIINRRRLWLLRDLELWEREKAFRRSIS